MSGREDVAVLLGRRRAELSRPRATLDHAASRPVLVVSVAGRLLGLDGRFVGQVRRSEGLCRLPHGCGALTALAPTGSGAVPVADLGLLVGAPAQESRPFLVLLETEAPVGLFVDAVHEVRSVSDRELLPTSAGDPPSVEHAVTADGLVLLDVPVLLDDARLRAGGSPTRGPATTRPPHPLESHVSDNHR